MIHRAVPDDELDAAVDELSAELRTQRHRRARARPSAASTRALDGGIAEAMEAEALALELSSRTADFREGLLAFKERRDARFDGR